MTNDDREKIEYLFSDFHNQYKINEENLFRIINDNSQTPLGKRFGFSGIKTLREYMLNVPLTDYSYYEENGNVFSYKHRYTLMTSGTTGASKRVFLSEEALERYSSYVFLMPFYLTGAEVKNVLHLSIFTPAEDASILSSAYYSFLKEKGLINCDDFVGGEACLFSREKADVPYVKLRCALACEDLTCICSTFLYDVLMAMNYLENNWEMLLEDMENGVVSRPVSDAMKEAILRLPVDRERLDYLRNEFSKGFDAPIIKRLWKNIKFISGVGGKLFDAYDKSLKRYTGDVDLYYFSYAQSECLSAVAVQMNDSSYTLMPRSAFFEFLSVDDGKAYLPEDVETGKRYQLIITTFSGMYRYKTGDIVEITGKTGQAPKFEIRDRAMHVLNIDGEKINETIIGTALDRLVSRLKLNLSTYYVGIDRSVMPSGYVLFLNVNNLDVNEKKIAREFDNILKDLSADYLDLRELKLINSPTCRLISQEAVKSIQTGHTKPGIILSDIKTDKLMNYEYK